MFVAATYSPRGSNDQPHIHGLFTTRAKAKAVILGLYQYKSTKVKWEGNSFYLVEDGERVRDGYGDEYPVGGVFSMTVDKNYKLEVVI